MRKTACSVFGVLADDSRTPLGMFGGQLLWPRSAGSCGTFELVAFELKSGKLIGGGFLRRAGTCNDIAIASEAVPMPATRRAGASCGWPGAEAHWK
jgi:hypothetical protein